MTQTIKWLYLLVLAVWIGSIVFFSFVVAPAVFKTLGPQEAGQLIRKIFSKYYLIGFLCAALGIICVGILLADGAFGKWPAILSLLLLAAMGGTDLWLRQAVFPQMNQMRDQIIAAGDKADPELEREWKTLHRLSVQLNGAVLLAALALLFVVVYARVV